jgi:hypothetical protein
VDGYETVDMMPEIERGTHNSNTNLQGKSKLTSNTSILSTNLLESEISESEDESERYRKSDSSTQLELEQISKEKAIETNPIYKRIIQHGDLKDDTTLSNRDWNDQIDNISVKKIRKPIVKKTFALKKIGYKVIPYDDESDTRYSFTNNNIVFVNKANSTYKAEAGRGDEFLLRHIIRIVADAIVQTKHPEGREALELQNRLVTEAIRIHDVTSKK